MSRRNRVSHGAQSPDEAEERRRLGREYLARRNQELLDLREKQKTRKSVTDVSEKEPPSPTFDQLVNADGTLKTNKKEQAKEHEEFNEKMLELPSVPTDEPKSLRRIAIHEPAVEAAFQTGSRYANPFGDEFELSGTLDSQSPTPKPPVPPKIALPDTKKIRKLSVAEKEPSIRQIPILEQAEPVPVDLSYDEQLARALSLSLAESEEAARLARAKEQEQRERDFAAAVAASLADVEKMRINETRDEQSNQLVSLTPDPPISVPTTTTTTSAQHHPSFDNDDLYMLSPNIALRRAVPAPIPEPMVISPYDPIHEAAAAPITPTITSPPQPPQPQLPHHQHSPTTATFSSPELERDAISFSSASSSVSNAFASAPASAAPSEMSLIDFADIESVDSDDDDDSEPDGVLTPGSWTDVGSEVGSEDQEGVRAA